MELISKFMPKVQERYNFQEEFVFVKSKLSFLDFQNKYVEIEKTLENSMDQVLNKKCS
jgi:hypothetical protein